MRHQVDGRKFGRNTSHRAAMYRNMANSIIEKEQVVTTVEKAKEIRRVVDRLVTLAKKNSPAARRMAFDRTRSDFIVKKLFSELNERYKDRNGGYTRVLKLAERRWGDSAEMAVVELVGHSPILRGKNAPGSKSKDATQAAPVAADPMSRLRKLFSGRKKTSAANPETGK